MGKTRVTVLLPVYNAAPYLAAAIQSILAQTFTNFKLLIINDGSTDQSDAVITSFNDIRINYVKHSHNLGLIATLNEGIGLNTDEFIVRMDADDISLPERIAKQVAFMDANPSVDIGGAWCSVIDSDQILSYPASSQQCKVRLLHNTVLAHPAVILRSESIKAAGLEYDAEAMYAEDYKFWALAATKGLTIENIQEVVLKYRIHNQQVSSKKVSEQITTVRNIKLWYVGHYFEKILLDRQDLYLNLLHSSINLFNDFTDARLLVNDLKKENSSHGYFDIAVFNAFFDDLLNTIATRIYVLCTDCNWRVLQISISDSYFYNSTNVFQKLRFFYKSIF